MSHTKSLIKLIRIALIILGVVLLQLVFLACMGDLSDGSGNSGTNGEVGDGDNSGGGTTPVVHVHKLVYSPATSPSCVKQGSTEFWQCSKCSLKFSDSDGTTVIENTAIPAIEHDYVDTYNDVAHYTACSNCSRVLDGSTTAHTKQYAADRTSHYQYCLCGWKSRPARHTAVDGEPCTECGFGGLMYELGADESYYICTGAPDTSRTTVAEYIIPDEYNGLPVKAIGERAFDSCTALEKISLGKNVQAIEEFAFKGCGKLKSVSLNDGLTEIGASAFTDCRALVSVEIPATVTDIGASVFRGCTGLKTVNIPDGINELGERMFFNCTSLESLVIPSSVTTIGVAAFSRSGLKTLTVPDGVTDVPQTMAESCSALEVVNLPASIASIGVGAFMNCKSLAALNFGGTAAEWEQISLGNMWNRNSDSMKIVCANPPSAE